MTVVVRKPRRKVSPDKALITRSEATAIAQASGGAPAWSAITGKPSTFPPDTHSHPQSEVTGLVAALAGKSDGGHGHSAATTGVAGFMAAADKSKLDGVATGATVNATDAALRDRATHTGAQAISTVTGLQAALDGKQAAGSYAAASHVHAIADTTGLQTALDGKAASSHTHPAAQISDSTAAGRSMLIAADAAAQTALLNPATTALKGLVPAPGSATGRVLKDDLTWATSGGGGATYAYGQLTADYTLASQTAAQKLFNFSANGALTLATGRYLFRAVIYLTTMSGTSGNGAFSLAGTATLANILYHVTGIDSSSPLAAGARGGSASVTSGSPASMVTAATGTGLVAIIEGMVNVTVTGTIIPSIALVTAAAALVKAGSFFECLRVGDTGANTQGAWS